MPGMVTSACDPSGGNKVMGYLVSGLVGGCQVWLEEGRRRLLRYWARSMGVQANNEKEKKGDVGYVPEVAWLPVLAFIRKSRGRFAVSS